MLAKDVVPGSIIEWDGYTAICVGKVGTNHPGCVLLGYTHLLRNYPNAWHISTKVHGTTLPADVIDALNKHKCEYGYWILNTSLIILKAVTNMKVAAAVMSAGISCRLCKDYAPHAAPNRPDGKSFICFSCRQGWIPLGM